MNLKRIIAPKTWPVKRKGKTWIARPSPGAHAKTHALPLSVVLRDMLKVADTTREVKKLLATGEVLVDGRKRRDANLSLGFLDVIELPATKKVYRMTYDDKGRLRPIEIPAGEKGVKACKIENKKLLKNGVLQLNLSGGRNIRVEKKGKDEYNTKDTLIISLPEQEIKKVIKYEKNSTVFVVSGKHAGEIAKLVKTHAFKGSQKDKILLKGPSGEYETLEDYAFVVGADKPEIRVK